MDRRRQDRRLLLTAFLLFATFLYKEIIIRPQELPSSDVSQKTVTSKEALYKSNEKKKQKGHGGVPTPFVPPTLPPVVEEAGKGINILCFGDSLTAGSLGIAYKGEFRPYATYLEANLKKLQRKSKDNGIVKHVQINHTGLPGYTSEDLNHWSAHHPPHLNRTLNTFKRADGSSLLDMVIILAGTNDILAQAYLEYNVAESVISMHQLVLDEHHIPLTMALDIPMSAVYNLDSNMFEQMDMLSQGLQKFAESEKRTTFMPFPFPYKGGEDWSKDGIHLSERGYKRLAELLAPVVQQSLQDAGLW